jgi:hypothetical protein
MNRTVPRTKRIEQEERKVSEITNESPLKLPEIHGGDFVRCED